MSAEKTEKAGPARGKTRRARLLIGVLLLLGVTSAIFFEQNRLTTERFELAFARLPKAFDGFTVAQISDLHAKQFGPGNERLISLVEKQKPDLIAVTGDLCRYPEQFPAAAELCAKLDEIAPVYLVFGNHEWAGRSVPQLKSALAGTGATVLQNEYVKLERGGSSICLLGLEDPNGPRDRKTMTETVLDLREREGDPFILTLSHRNTLYEEYARHRLDLVLCGHAHGGVVRLPFTDGLIGTQGDLFPKYTAGVYPIGDTVMVVSRGLGNSNGEFRVFNPPDLPVVVLRPAG